MQYDMHYYGTYAMAMAAGFSKTDAQAIAMSAQWVDDQAKRSVAVLDDGAAVQGIATGHHPLDAGVRAKLDDDNIENDTRLVWVPFHFLPGGEGTTFQERLLCRKDSPIARVMLENHLEHAQEPWGLQLAGIAAHVYADTFSHYGFSGISSDLNKVDNSSFEFGTHASSVLDYIKQKAEGFLGALGPNQVALGHGAVATYPDRPYLKFKFEYADGRLSGWRDNPATFLEGCEKLHGYFHRFAQARYGTVAASSPFSKIEDGVREVLAEEENAEGRVEAWKAAMAAGQLGHVEPCDDYDPTHWTSSADSNDDLLKEPGYAFHQAAEHHRTYVLRRLLPAHGLAVI